MAQRYATRDDVAGASGTPGGVAPELNGIADAVFDVWLAIAAEHIGLARWGSRASYGHALLTAHYVSIAPDASGDAIAAEAGPLSGEAHGPSSRSFQQVPITDADLATTTYGRLFASLRRVVRGRGSGVVGNRAARQKQ